MLHVGIEVCIGLVQGLIGFVGLGLGFYGFLRFCGQGGTACFGRTVANHVWWY